MRLSMRRFEEKGGLFGRKTIYKLAVRAEMSAQELFLIHKHDIEKYTVLEAAPNEPWNEITVRRLHQGTTLRFDRFEDLLEAEEFLPKSCKNLKAFLEEASTDKDCTVTEI